MTDKPDKLTMQQTKVNYGGLMRCCLSSLGLYVKSVPEQEAYEEDTIECTYCGNPMILEDGVWRWNKENAND